MGLKHFLHRWWNTTPLSCRTMTSVPCVEDAGSVGKGSHLKYHCRGSQRSGTQLTQTPSAAGREADSTISVGCWLKAVTLQDWAHLNPVQNHWEESLPRPHSPTLTALLPAHPQVPPLGSSLTAQPSSSSHSVFQPGEFSHGLTSETSSLCSCTNTRGKTREEEGSPFQQQWAWAASSAFSGNCTLRLSFSSFLLLKTSFLSPFLTAAEWHTLLEIFHTKLSINLTQVSSI